MSDHYLTDGTITTEQDFEAVLAGAVEQAVSAGIDVRGPWEFETVGSIQHWEVEVVELRTDLDPDDKA